MTRTPPPRRHRRILFHTAIAVTLLLGTGAALDRAQRSEGKGPKPDLEVSDVPVLETSVAAAVMPTASLRDEPQLSFLATYELPDSAFEAATPEPLPAELTALPMAHEEVVRVKRGDTLLGLLSSAGVELGQARSAVASLDGLFDPRYIQPGQEIRLALQVEQGDGNVQIAGLSFQRDFETRIVVLRDDDGEFASRAVDRPLQLDYAGARGTIETSLFNAANEARVPAMAMTEMVRALSFDIDFQRDLHRGDGFEILYERFLDETGTVVRTGPVLYARMDLRGREIEFYRHATADGVPEYFDASGVSVRKSLMRTPIDGARLSSGYGMRRHPIAGYNKMHRGVDFAAPRGTPIYAAGDGVIESVGWKGGFGKYVRIRHNATYSTAYAHMARFAKGIKKGTRVRQGQVIGRVGSTGRSTAPHLHYEVLVNGRQVNPRRVKLPTGRTLSAGELERFRLVRAEIDRLRQRYSTPVVAGRACEGDC